MGQKGGGFERDQARAWSLWWSTGERNDLFWRTGGSGSRATNLRRLGQMLTMFQYGDMTFIDPKGRLLVEHFNFEFKRCHKVEAHGMLYATDPGRSLLSFWAQCLRDADLSGRGPVLVSRMDRGKAVMWTDCGSYGRFRDCGFRPATLARFRVPAQKVALKARGKKKKEAYAIHGQDVFGFLLEDFFQEVDPEVVRVRLENGGTSERPGVLREGSEA